MLPMRVEKIDYGKARLVAEDLNGTTYFVTNNQTNIKNKFFRLREPLLLTEENISDFEILVSNLEANSKILRKNETKGNETK